MNRANAKDINWVLVSGGEDEIDEEMLRIF